ncbi:MAG: hypothetical protein KatS3mg035_1645 [Bacteroidia bacterium]|nr:MAG: hypothetical protein KatS3mg035_1645 [Bacteroidia bacterium]
MKDFTEVIKRKFPYDEKLEFYVKPNMPAGKLGKALASNSKIQAAEVIAFHLYSGLFSSGAVVFTPTLCYFEGGSLKLEDLKSVSISDKFIQVEVNQGGRLTSSKIRCQNAEAAALLAHVFNAIIDLPKTDDIPILTEKKDYSSYSKEAINWLELRDEIMATIDMLHQRFMDGKISLIEYEDKKTDLLSRL